MSAGRALVPELRILFAGTPVFALASLEALVTAGLGPVAVLTQPDRPAGRGRQTRFSPVKAYAVSEGIEVLQPTTLRDPEVQRTLAGFEPDVLVVAAYGLLLPRAVLDIPRKGCINVHASLLPRWRGAAPVQAAILAGDDQSGVCLMRMEEGLDTGPVFASEAVRVDTGMTAGDLHDRLAAMGGSLLADNLVAIVEGSLPASPQDESLATYAPKIRSADAILDWSEPAVSLDRKVRAFNPVPGARFRFDGEDIKCWRAVPGEAGGRAGTVLDAGADGIVVACGEGSLRLLELQRPGRRRVSAAEFRGQFDLAGRRFG